MLGNKHGIGSAPDMTAHLRRPQVAAFIGDWAEGCAAAALSYTAALSSRQQCERGADWTAFVASTSARADCRTFGYEAW